MFITSNTFTMMSAAKAIMKEARTSRLLMSFIIGQKIFRLVLV